MRTLGGTREARTLGGAREALTLWGARVERALGGARVALTLGGTREARTPGVAREARTPGGAREVRTQWRLRRVFEVGQVRGAVVEVCGGPRHGVSWGGATHSSWSGMMKLRDYLDFQIRTVKKQHKINKLRWEDHSV